MKNRCGWVPDKEIYIKYHDREWGVPIYEDRLLFEYVILEGAHAGLSWLTILNKRENYREAFDDFDAEKIAQYDDAKKRELLANAGIVRNRLKIDSTIGNARAYLNILAEFGSFSDYLWAFVDGRPLHNNWKDWREIPATSTISDNLSRDLKKRGFKFVGSTICYAFMQAVGMVNDHATDCFRHEEIINLSK